ncbi:MAG: hypothetical protein EOP07_19260 [Proteobacteria bacterium]|nr:MAG: hypothetical protein EOP07_19260 [Pseudomonadota bacterium]
MARNQATTLSDLSILKSLLTSSRVHSGGYEPAIFPQNYFAQSWDLTKNPKTDLKGVSTSGLTVNLPTISAEALTPEQFAQVFANRSDRLSLGSKQQKLTIKSINRNESHPHYIESVDVEVTRISKIPGGNESATLTSSGRIPLDPPVPIDGQVLIKRSDETSYSSNFGTKQKPLSPGSYTFQIRGSGVVQYADVTINGEKQRVGVSGGVVTSKANSIRAVQEIIGETTPFQLGAIPSSSSVSTSGPQSSLSIDKASCKLVTSGPSTASASASASASPSASSTFRLEVQLVGVTGNSASVEFSQSIYLGPQADELGPRLPSDNNGDRTASSCQSKCPTNYREVYAGGNSFAGFLDIAARHPADLTLVDLWHGGRTQELNDAGVKGLVCVNYELIGDAMVARTGQLPMALRVGDPRMYNMLENNYINMERFYAYLEPTCEREFIGVRDACGCFAEDTSILFADGSSKAAQDVRQGDWLWNPKNKSAQQVKRVIAGPEKFPLIQVKSAGRTVSVTRDHPFLTPEGLKTATELRVGDQILGESSTDVVEAINELASDNPAPVVWNFELEGSEADDDHYVSANGIMTGDLYLQIKLKKSKPDEDPIGKNN